MITMVKRCGLAGGLLLLASSVYAEVSRDAWIESMKTALPTAFCQSHQYFRQCFQVTQQECVDTASAAALSCLERNKSQMPAVFTREDGRQWGGVVGGCAGSAYELTLSKKRISSDLCNDENNWK